MRNLSLLASEEDQWLAVLMPHEREQVIPLLAKGLPPDELVQQWLEIAGQSSTIGFGGPPDTPSFYQAFLAEVRKLLCAQDPSYEEVRKKLAAGGEVSKTVITSLIASTVGSVLGV